jgi:hypothetical protein
MGAVRYAADASYALVGRQPVRELSHLRVSIEESKVVTVVG